MARTEGQIWISRDQPHTLKYYASGKEYWAVSAATFLAATPIKKGQILAANTAPGGLSEGVIPAVWPRDTDRIVGMALNSAGVSETVRVVNYGYIKLNAAELAACFTTQSDITASAELQAGSYYTAFGSMTADGGAGNGWDDATTDHNGRGANIYWFSGRTLKTATGYEWKDSASYPGKLTLSTPTGYKPTGTEIPWADDSLNVAYKNIPVVGNVIDYEYNPTTKAITTLIMQINFTKFSKKLQFEYPASGLEHYDSPGTPLELNLRHGLFSNNGRPYIEVSMWGFSDADIETSADGEASRVFPGYDSYIGPAVDKRTEVEITSDTAFYYKVLGEVSYNL